MSTDLKRKKPWNIKSKRGSFLKLKKHINTALLRQLSLVASLLKQDLHKNLGATCDHPKHPSTFPQASAEYIYIYNSPMPPLKPWYMQLWSQWIPRPACIQVVAAQGFVCSAKPEVGFPWTRKTCVVNIFWATLFWNNKIMLTTKVGAAYHHHTIGWLVLQQDQWGNSPNPNSSWKFEV